MLLLLGERKHEPAPRVEPWLLCYSGRAWPGSDLSLRRRWRPGWRRERSLSLLHVSHESWSLPAWRRTAWAAARGTGEWEPRCGVGARVVTSQQVFEGEMAPREPHLASLYAPTPQPDAGATAKTARERLQARLYGLRHHTRHCSRLKTCTTSRSISSPVQLTQQMDQRVQQWIPPHSWLHFLLY